MNRFAAIVLVCFAAIGLSACGSDDNGPSKPIATTDIQKSNTFQSIMGEGKVQVVEIDGRYCIVAENYHNGPSEAAGGIGIWCESAGTVQP